MPHSKLRAALGKIRQAAGLALLAAGAGVLPPAGVSGGAAVPDGPARAAIVLNIIRFVDFGVYSGPLYLCVSRATITAPAVLALGGKRVGVRPIALRELSGAAATCDVVYLTADEAYAISRVHQPGVLVIGDGSGFIEAGGTIGLVGTGSQIRFEANTRAAAQAQIKLSSKLLRLAARIRS